MYGLHGKLVAKPKAAEALAEILLQAAALMKSIDGCLLYSVSRDHKNLNEVWVTEIWLSKDHHGVSISEPHVGELIKQAMPLLAENPERGQELEVLGGFGIQEVKVKG